MWPNGATSAAVVSFDFDAEEVWIGEDPENANRPGTLSQGTYGAKVAVPRVLDLLDRLSLTATFFVPGRVAERYPDRVRDIISGPAMDAPPGFDRTRGGMAGIQSIWRPVPHPRGDRRTRCQSAARSARESAERQALNGPIDQANPPAPSPV